MEIATGTKSYAAFFAGAGGNVSIRRHVEIASGMQWRSKGRKEGGDGVRRVEDSGKVLLIFRQWMDG